MAQARLEGGAYLVFGQHPVRAALGNPRRRVRRLLAVPQRLAEAEALLKGARCRQAPRAADRIEASELDHMFPGHPHQGIAAEVLPLEPEDLLDVCRIETPSEGSNLVLVLDQVTDPHNVGAIIRSAAAFGARALVTPDRNTPPETGTLAKSASGALEILPWVRVTNLARALEALAELGYWRIGLDGAAEADIEAIDMGQNIVLVLGSEGSGLRPNTAAHCDALARLPISPHVESLNVSNAAAVALYALTRPRA